MACSGMAVRRLAPYNLERSRDPETTRGQRHICNLRDAGATCSHVVVAPITWRAGYTTMTMTMITGVATDDHRRRFDRDARRRRRRSSDDDDRFTNDDSMTSLRSNALRIISHPKKEASNRSDSSRRVFISKAESPSRFIHLLLPRTNKGAFRLTIIVSM